MQDERGCEVQSVNVEDRDKIPCARQFGHEEREMSRFKVQTG